jgi:hypothetical protein
MLRMVSRTVFALLISAVPVFAQFEGVLEMKTTMGSGEGEGMGGGTMKVAVGKQGARIEMNTKAGGMSINSVMLVRNDSPDVVYRIDDANKSYSEIDLTKARAMANVKEDATGYTVEKLGEEKILGYNTQHVLVKEKNATKSDAVKSELWVAKGFGDYDLMSKVGGRSGGGQGMAKALKEAGAEGLPLKSIHTTADGMSVKAEVVKIDKQTLPGATFEIPSGYTKSEGGMMGMMGGMGAVSGPGSDDMKKKMGDAQQRMQEALKNLSPEQREMVEKMMKQRPAPGQ